MSRVRLASGVEELTVRARIIRADGTVEDLGTVAHHERLRSRVRRFVSKFRRKVN